LNRRAPRIGLIAKKGQLLNATVSFALFYEKRLDQVLGDRFPAVIVDPFYKAPESIADKEKTTARAISPPFAQRPVEFAPRMESRHFSRTAINHIRCDNSAGRNWPSAVILSARRLLSPDFHNA